MHFGVENTRFCNIKRKRFVILSEGAEWIVDIDLEKFFDNVPQDKLMSYVGRIIYDLDTESLIRKYLKSGVMEHGLKGKMVKIDEHLRTMLRKVIWKQWKTPRKQPWGLRKLGICNDLAKLTSYSGDRYEWGVRGEETKVGQKTFVSRPTRFCTSRGRLR